MDELASADHSRPSHDAGEGAGERPRQALHTLHQQLRDTARKAGHQEGYQAGHQEGHREGYQAGLDEGREQGLEQGREIARQQFEDQRRELLAPLAPLADQLRQALIRLDGDIADTLVDLALATGRQLADDSLAAHPEQVRTLIQRLLHEEALFSGKLNLWLHPDDLSLIDEPLTSVLHNAGWATRSDATLSRGGCRVTSAEGELDATRESRWQALLARTRRVHKRTFHTGDTDNSNSAGGTVP